VCKIQPYQSIVLLLIANYSLIRCRENTGKFTISTTVFKLETSMHYFDTSK